MKKILLIASLLLITACNHREKVKVHCIKMKHISNSISSYLV